MFKSFKDMSIWSEAIEIAEVIFQTSIYGGVPAANTALSVLKDVLEERGEE